jgi:hypothetical protein
MKAGFFKLKGVRIILGVSIVVGLLAFAISCMSNKKAEIITEMEAYLTNTIEPEVKLQREKFDKVLTDSEKQRIAELRMDAKAMADSAVKFHVKIAKLGEDATYQLSEAEIDYYNDSQKKTRKIITECWTILDNHEAEFAALQKVMYPKMVGWHTDMMKKIIKNMPFNLHGHIKKVLNLQIKGLELLGPGSMSPVFFLIYEPETNFPLSLLKSAMDSHKKMKCN